MNRRQFIRYAFGSAVTIAIPSCLIPDEPVPTIQDSFPPSENYICAWHEMDLSSDFDLCIDFCYGAGEFRIDSIEKKEISV